MLSDQFDLAALRLTSGEGRRLELAVSLDPVTFGGQTYTPQPVPLSVRLDISRMTGDGYALRARLAATIVGPCMRCLTDASPTFEVDAREVDQPGAGDDLESPYVTDQVLDLAGWARDALVLALPAALLCRPECAGLCPICGEDLNGVEGEHDHGRTPDPRWAKLSELRLQ